jgi:hypothetical protein
MEPTLNKFWLGKANIVTMSKYTAGSITPRHNFAFLSDGKTMIQSAADYLNF